MGGPLTGIRALDLGRAVQIPGAMTLLSEWGAEVIKIEEPAPDPSSSRYRISPIGVALDRGKRSLALNLKHPKGKEILLKLISISDVIGENFRLGAMDRLGLHYESVRKVNPRIIYASGRGYGSRGPRRFDPGYDPVGQAMSGMMHLNGEPDGYPLPAGYAVVDYMSSLHIALGIMVALYDREHTGTGQALETSLLGSAIHSQNWSMAISWSEGKSRRRAGRRAGGLPSAAGLPATYRTADGYLQIMNIVSDHYWAGFCEGLGREALLNDSRFDTERHRIENSSQLLQIIEDCLLLKTTSEWVERFRATNQIVSPILDHYEVKDDPQVRANDYVVDVEHPLLGKIPTVGHPIRFENFPISISEAAPEVGEHTDVILGELAYSAEEIKSFRKDGIVQ